MYFCPPPKPFLYKPVSQVPQFPQVSQVSDQSIPNAEPPKQPKFKRALFLRLTKASDEKPQEGVFCQVCSFGVNILGTTTEEMLRIIAAKSIATKGPVNDSPNFGDAIADARPIARLYKLSTLLYHLPADSAKSTEIINLVNQIFFVYSPSDKPSEESLNPNINTWKFSEEIFTLFMQKLSKNLSDGNHKNDPEKMNDPDEYSSLADKVLTSYLKNQNNWHQKLTPEEKADVAEILADFMEVNYENLLNMPSEDFENIKAVKVVKAVKDLLKYIDAQTITKFIKLNISKPAKNNFKIPTYTYTDTCTLIMEVLRPPYKGNTDFIASCYLPPNTPHQIRSELQAAISDNPWFAPNKNK